MSSEPNAYELQRQQLIERNRARLEALGIISAASALHASTSKAPAKPKKKAEKKAGVRHEPSRHSARLHPDAAGGSSEASELALCIVNGACPRCGKFVDVGHKKHLDHCSGDRKRKRGNNEGHVEIEGLDELEEEEQRLQENPESADTRPAKKSKPSKSQAEKLKELELSGLVDFDENHARFVVIGSTGSHYHVELKEPAHSCQCVDYRIRKRICKHQKLVLLQLGIPDNPEDWHKAVSSKLDKLAEAQPTERQSHLGETEYDPDYEEASANTSKTLKAMPKHSQSTRKKAASSAKQHSNDEEEQKDDDKEGEDAKKSPAGQGNLSPAGLAWPKRPPRKS